jgi:tyrosyl-tRNA synthetase
VEQLFDTSTADSCLSQFQKSVQNSEIPEDISEIESDNIIDAVSKIRNCSRSEARRLLVQGAVSIDNKKSSENTEIHAGQIIKAGKRNFGRVI